MARSRGDRIAAALSSAIAGVPEPAGGDRVPDL
jgi:hypothetical protein